MGKDGKPAAAGKVVTASRFAAVHHDPRFQKFPRAKAKVEIDERFAGGWAPPAAPARRLSAVGDVAAAFRQPANIAYWRILQLGWGLVRDS
jgi:hypothetical protein